MICAYCEYLQVYAMEGDKPELTTLKKYAKEFKTEEQAKAYMKKYFNIAKVDVVGVEKNQ